MEQIPATQKERNMRMRSHTTDIVGLELAILIDDVFTERTRSIKQGFSFPFLSSPEKCESDQSTGTYGPPCQIQFSISH